jgi:uncharacterized protein YnzC (UPF0291/DUF896 family)
MFTMTSLRKDYIASHLRAQVNALKSVLDALECSDDFDNDYTDESLKRVEINLRGMRKSLQN